MVSFRDAIQSVMAVGFHVPAVLDNEQSGSLGHLRTDIHEVDNRAHSKASANQHVVWILKI